MHIGKDVHPAAQSSHDRGIWDSGAKLSVRHFVSVKAFLLSKGRRRRWGKIAESTFS